MAEPTPIPDHEAPQESQDPHESIHQPHDKFFRTNYRNIATVTEFFKNYLPPALVEAIDWTTLKLVPSSFISNELKASESDLLYSVQFQGQEIFLYILFEHQSVEDPWMPFRLLVYMVHAWGVFRKNNPEATKLPAIFPVVLAQNDKNWTVSPRFIDLIDIPTNLLPVLKPYIPDFSYHLFELSKHNYDDFLGTPLGIMVLRLLKAERLKDLQNPKVLDETLLLRLSPEELFSVIHYIFHVGNLDTKTIETIIQGIKAESIRNTTMTLAQKYIQEGRQEGEEQGLLKGRQEGRQEGLLAGKIQVCQQILGEMETPMEELTALPQSELEKRNQQYQARVLQYIRH
ncbi:MAG: Rpn family recombination-promoting nuclease/putative transposase [Verrucomicrobiota bacterium]|nr:Rpn family recombination-promoting nuclease/putative transposase [Verrucomicrobiota bacterium]